MPGVCSHLDWDRSPIFPTNHPLSHLLHYRVNPPSRHRLSENNKRLCIIGASAQPGRVILWEDRRLGDVQGFRLRGRSRLNIRACLCWGDTGEIALCISGQSFCTRLTPTSNSSLASCYGYRVKVTQPHFQARGSKDLETFGLKQYPGRWSLPVMATDSTPRRQDYQ